VPASPHIGFTLTLKAQRNDPVVMGRISVVGHLNPSIVTLSPYKEIEKITSVIEI
jgi:hypothetical protein